MKATFIKNITDWRGKASLYKVEPPIEYDSPYDADDPPAKHSDYVIISAVYADFTGPETYMFPANENAEVLSWGELDGSFRGGLDHEKALQNAGYTEITKA
jgi:hypothetical protein